MPDVTPFPKSVQLERGERRYRRRTAGPKSWQRLWDEKGGPCRVCGDYGGAILALHHLVFREDHGDDLADNLVPVCWDCHRALHLRRDATCRLLLSRLTDAERSYMVARGGPDYFVQVYGVECDS